VVIAGLTGSIAMGKSTVAEMFAELGAPVFDADAAVREFYASADAGIVEKAFPGVLVDGRVDRARLAERVLGDASALRRLEGLVHPAVASRRAQFLRQAAAQGRRIAILDIPLLFETQAERSVDVVLVVSAPEAAQRERALARDGMTPQKLEAILERQTPDGEKRRRAHAVIDTGLDKPRTRAQIDGLMRALAAMPGKARDHA
jgi:dephospho-CoA kinase